MGFFSPNSLQSDSLNLLWLICFSVNRNSYLHKWFLSPISWLIKGGGTTTHKTKIWVTNRDRCQARNLHRPLPNFRDRSWQQETGERSMDWKTTGRKSRYFTRTWKVVSQQDFCLPVAAHEACDRPGSLLGLFIVDKKEKNDLQWIPYVEKTIFSCLVHLVPKVKEDRKVFLKTCTFVIYDVQNHV